jgi:hypothetical protein
MKTPVAVLIFNRPEATARVLEAVRRARPPMLMVVADGPRADRSGESAQCAAARAVVDKIDWGCEVRKHYSDINLGCKRRVGSGLGWVFQNSPEAIILEDDCLPHETFFPYCEALLERYREDERVMHIGGNNFGIDEREFGPLSYGFSSFPQVWGWATWRRAWQHFDLTMSAWPSFRDNRGLGELPMRRSLRGRQIRRWEDAYSNRVDTWDFQWHFAVMSRNGLATVPRRNLVSNMGFAPDATHTRDMTSDKADVPLHALEFPLAHPAFVRAQPALDDYFSTKMLGDSLASRVLGKARRLLSNPRQES